MTAPLPAAFWPSSLPSHEHTYSICRFAVVAVPGGYAGTTRAADRGEAGRVGLPGGKVDAGETPAQALLREAREEGWGMAGVCSTPLHTALVDGRLVHWYRVRSAVQLTTYAEIGRISPVVLSRDQVLASGYGNDRLPI